MHADVIAGRQMNQTLKKIIRNFMNKYVSPPCNSSLATSFNIEKKGTTEEEVGITSLFGGSVASDVTSDNWQLTWVFLKAM